MRNTLILLGYGRCRRVIADQLKTDRQPLVLIEINLEIEPKLIRNGLYYTIGSALDQAVLEAAGIAVRAIGRDGVGFR